MNDLSRFYSPIRRERKQNAYRSNENALTSSMLRWLDYLIHACSQRYGCSEISLLKVIFQWCGRDGDFSVDLWFIILMHMKIVKFHLGGSKMVFVTEMKIDSRIILRFWRSTAACGKWHFCARTCRTKVSLIGMMSIIREIPRKQKRNCVSIPTITTYE